MTHRHKAKFPKFDLFKNRSSYKIEDDEAIDNSRYGTFFEPINTSITSSFRLFHKSSNGAKDNGSISKSMNACSLGKCHKESMNKSARAFSTNKAHNESIKNSRHSIFNSKNTSAKVKVG